MSSKRTTNEFFVRYNHNFNDYLAILNSSCKVWNNAAKNQLRRKVKYLEGVLEDNKEGTKTFEISFQNGSKAHFLFVPNNIEVFDLHTELREAFNDKIKDSDNISFNLFNISFAHQTVLVDSLTRLVHLAGWVMPQYGVRAKKKSPVQKRKFGFYCDLDAEEVGKVLYQAELVAKGTNLVRQLAYTPTNHMDSKALVKAGEKIASKIKKSNVSFAFLGEESLKEIGANLFLAVIRGTKGSGGGILHLSYTPDTESKDYPKIGLIGKGITFDTGGYDLKTDGAMKNMHRDMTGAAVVLAIFEAAVKNKVKAKINAYLAIGENMVSEASLRPNEVIETLNGVSVEITNTDAEGRLVLADTLAFANRTKDHDILITFATLTGEAVSSMDQKYACVMSSDLAITQKAIETGFECGERVWGFPLTKDFSKKLESEIADIRQESTSSNADHIYAGAFLKFFADGVPFVHVDLSCEESDGGLGLVDTDVTGFGVKWGISFIDKIIGGL